MSARVEVTKKYATAYANAGKKDKGRILDQVVEVTGWNRDHARQQLRGRLRQPLGRAQATIAVIDGRRSKPRKYSCDALRVLQRVWSTSGGLCGKYLAASMPPGRPLAASRSVEAGSSFRPESGPLGHLDETVPNHRRRIVPRRDRPVTPSGGKDGPRCFRPPSRRGAQEVIIKVLRGEPPKLFSVVNWVI